MRKIHTKIKRKRRLSTHQGAYKFFHPKKRKRAKTFSTEEKAKAWAGEQGLKGGEYTLRKVKKGKRWEIVKSSEQF